MTNKTYTLNRWHHIAARIKEAAAEMKQKNEEVLLASRNIDGDTFAVRRAALSAAATKAAGADTALYFALQGALFAIRRAVSHANIPAGVSDLLAQQEEANQAVAYYDALLKTAQGALSPAEFGELAKRKQAARESMYGVTVTFLSEEQIVELTKQRDAQRRLFNSLKDRAATANATLLEVEIDDNVVEHVGL